MKRILFFLIVITGSLVFGQSISGTVTDRITNGNLSGVNIIIKGSDQGVSSDADGRYTLDVSELADDHIIVFQHIGYDELSISIAKLSASSDVKLNPRVLPFAAIETAGQKRKAAIAKDLPQTVSILQAESFELRAFVDAGDLLATDQSVQIEESLSAVSYTHLTLPTIYSV